MKYKAPREVDFRDAPTTPPTGKILKRIPREEVLRAKNHGVERR